ncbi:MAG TPA: cellulase family glycosylhydrolase [Ktedonobacteraceae bacterium]|nr:cellulase family glycosylhydrolase [Ktedonobacteraceae bacterium]
MTDHTEGFHSTRRSFLRTAAAGLAATGAVLASPLLALADPFEPAFVGRRGSNFTLRDDLFYFAGTNNYYLHYQSHFMIDDVLKNAVAMGLPVIRLWGFLDGNPANGFVMQSSPGVYPEAGYERFDYTVSRAAQLGLKLVVVFVNNWNDFGGMNQYVSWFGASSHDEFYTNEQIKTAYKRYVQHFLHRTNRYTGRQMINEPAIMTWELANEPRCLSDPTGDTLFNWVREMSFFIKSMDHRHLVAVGDEGFYNIPGNPDFIYNGSQGDDWKRFISLPTIDYGTMHLYPDGWGKDEAWALQWIKNHIHDARAAGKPVVLEEYGWKDLTTRDTIYQTWLDTIYQEGGNGDQFWILTGLQDDGTLYPNYDGFRVTYPSSTASVISAHAAQMKAKSGRRF